MIALGIQPLRFCESGLVFGRASNRKASPHYKVMVETRNRYVSKNGAPSIGSVVSGRVGVRRGCRQKFHIATLNIGTMRGRSSEVAETISRRKIDYCCLQETRWKGGSARMFY